MRNFSEEEFGRIFCGVKRRKKPGYTLQFLEIASRFLRDFRFYPLRAHGLTLRLNLWTWGRSSGAKRLYRVQNAPAFFTAVFIFRWIWKT
jgi:hypothetical protein